MATGGNAPVILRYCRNRIIYDKYLLMEGLWAIYQNGIAKGKARCADGHSASGLFFSAVG